MRFARRLLWALRQREQIVWVKAICRSLEILMTISAYRNHDWNVSGTSPNMKLPFSALNSLHSFLLCDLPTLAAIVEAADVSDARVWFHAR